MTDPRRDIPGVDALLESEPFRTLLRERPRSRVLEVVRDELDRLRAELTAGRRDRVPDADELARAARATLADEDRGSLRRVINATGIPLHTNLGRAPLAREAVDALMTVAGGYSNLEYDLERGARGSRYDHCADLLCRLTGAEAALVVNNNAAAVLLVLNELAEGAEAIVSRGELVEIGGSFRVPEIIAKSGARIVEVGTTNRTHPADYERAIGPETGALLKVHRSNFRQTGFVAEVEIDELVSLGRRHDVPVVHDLGSGLLPGTEGAFGLPPEPSARGSVGDGADLVTFSADKLLGGPQAGIIVGRGALVGRLRRNPLLRAFRVDKLTLAALEATLMLWRDEERALRVLPALAMITAEEAELRSRAKHLAARLADAVPTADIDVARSTAEVGGGSYPGVELPSWVIRVRAPGRSEADLEAACRSAEPPIIGRTRDGALCLDPRTVRPEEEVEFVRALTTALTS